MEFAFEGGLAPYKIEHFLFVWETTNGGSQYKRAFAFRHLTVQDPYDTDLVFENVNKETKFKNGLEYFYYVEVRDAQGQKCSEIIPFYWK